MKKRMLALSLAMCFALSACGSTTETELAVSTSPETTEMQEAVIAEETKAETTELSAISLTYSSPIVTTGQTDTYDADGNVIDTATAGFYGQDGDYESLAFSFTLNDDGTTTDNNTDLTWVTEPDAGKLTWDEAVEYVESLNTMVNDDGTVGFAGRADWRLPSTEELFSISDFSIGWPYIDTDYFGFDDAASEEMGGMDGSPQGGSPQGGDSGDMAMPEMSEGMGQQGGMSGSPQGGGSGDMAMPEMSEGMGQQGGMSGAPQGGGSGDMAMPEMSEGMGQQGGMSGTPQGGGSGDMAMPEMSEEMPMDQMTGGADEGGGVSKEEGQYWTSEYNQVEGDDRLGDIAFGVNHATGHIKAYPSNSAGMGKYVRAVAGDAYGAEDYTNNGDGTITDNASGLMWIEVDLGVAVDWEEALALAESSEFAGYDDWRLPDVKELQSIVSYDGSYPAINQDYFEITELEENENYYFWTSTSAYFSEMEPDYNSAWYVAFGYTSHGAGAVRFSPKYEGSDALSEGEDNILNSVRLVRNVN